MHVSIFLFKNLFLDFYRGEIMFQYDEEINATQVGFKDFPQYNLKKMNSDIFNICLRLRFMVFGIFIYFYGQV